MQPAPSQPLHNDAQSTPPNSASAPPPAQPTVTLDPRSFSFGNLDEGLQTLIEAKRARLAALKQQSGTPKAA